MPAVAARISHTAWGLDSAPTGDWRTRAACRTAPDPDLWYPPTYGTGTPRVIDAKRVCRHCPVRRACGAEATGRREPHGIWGGRTPHERGIRDRKTKSSTGEEHHA